MPDTTTAPEPKRSPLKRATSGLTVIAIGAVLLANTTGALPWGAWLTVLSLWPILVISIGVELVGKGLGSAWVRAASDLLVIGALLVGAFVLHPLDQPVGLGLAIGPVEEFDIERTLPADVDEATLVVEGAFDGIEIEATPGDAVELTGDSAAGEPVVEVTTEADGTVVTVRFGQDGAFLAGLGRSTTQVRLPRDVRWSLDLDIGVASLDAGLEDLEVGDIMLDMGVSNAELEFGDIAPGSTVEVEGGVGSLRIRIPEDVRARVSSAGGLSSLDLEGGWDRSGDDEWISEGTDDGDEDVEVLLDVGVSDIDIERY